MKAKDLSNELNFSMSLASRLLFPPILGIAKFVQLGLADIIYWIAAKLIVITASHEEKRLVMDRANNSQKFTLSIFFALTGAANFMSGLHSARSVKGKILFTHPGTRFVAYERRKTKTSFNIRGVNANGNLIWLSSTVRTGVFIRSDSHYLDGDRIATYFCWLSGKFEGKVFMLPQQYLSFDQMKEELKDETTPELVWIPNIVFVFLIDATVVLLAWALAAGILKLDTNILSKRFL